MNQLVVREEINMKILCILIITIFFNISTTWASSGYWPKISELSKQGTPRGNPALEKYLKSLTEEQMLIALRECCEEAEKNVPKEKWEQVVLPAMIVLNFYGDRKGRLSDEDLDNLLILIADKKEGELFREALVRVLYEKHWGQLNKNQNKRSIKTLSSLLNDKGVSLRLRILCCRKLELRFGRDYRKIIYADDNVRRLRNDKEKWRNLFNLLDIGKVRINNETKKALLSLKEQSDDYTTILVKILKDETEPPDLKKRVQKSLNAINKLTLLKKNYSFPGKSQK